MDANEEWDGDKHSIPECKELSEQYLALDNGILSSSEAIYEKKGLKVQVRSTHAKSPWDVWETKRQQQPLQTKYC